MDLLEVSGGTYEQLEFFKPQDPAEIRDSTREREAMFLKYATAIQAVASMPVMVTGGFRSRAGMEAALASGDTNLIGLARPFCLDPDLLHHAGGTSRPPGAPARRCRKYELVLGQGLGT